MKSRFNGTGYFLNDDRNSGGLRTEDDLLGCKHCQALLRRAEWQQGGAYCPNCDGPICVSCGLKMRAEGCKNFEREFMKQLEDRLRQEQNLRIIGAIGR